MVLAHTSAIVSAMLIATGFASGIAVADVTIPGDVVVPVGGVLLINDNTTYTGSLTIEAGAQIIMGDLWEIRIGNGATLTVNGTEAQPVDFFSINNEWGGIRMLDGSTGAMTHAEICAVEIYGIVINDATLTMESCWVYDESESSMNHFGARLAIRLNDSAVLKMNNSQIGPFYGRAGADGGPEWGEGDSGQSAYGVFALNATSVTITNSRFTQIRGGEGGKGDTGSTGETGEDGPDQALFVGVQGGQGGVGGAGWNGGYGGHSYSVYVKGTSSTLIAQNVFHVPTGGQGGQGGRGGKGGTGGQGGDGTNGVFSNGGAGGKGGTGGTGGHGGRGGESGDAYAIFIRNPRVNAAQIINNTISYVTGQFGGQRGDQGFGGTGGPGGQGGTNISGGNADSGDPGDTGAIGTFGVTGNHGKAWMLYGWDPAPSGFIAHFNNNIGTFTGFGQTTAIEQTVSGVIDADSNLVAFSDITKVGTVTGTLISGNPLFVDLENYRLGENSPAIDAGLNAVVPVELETDFHGEPRFMDDLATPDTGTGSPAVVDLGATEFPGETYDCSIDLNGDGIVDLGDIQTFVSLFLAGAIAVDFNGDGFLDLGDIDAFVQAFLAGC